MSNGAAYNFAHWTHLEVSLEFSRRMALVCGDWRASIKCTEDPYAHALYAELIRRRRSFQPVWGGGRVRMSTHIEAKLPNGSRYGCSAGAIINATADESSERGAAVRKAWRSHRATISQILAIALEDALDYSPRF